MLKENYKMTEVINILYEANKLGLWLWLQNDAIKFKSPENIDVSELMLKLKQHKNEVMEVLKQNKIFSDKGTGQHIYQTGLNSAMLSFAQESLWFIEQYEEGTNAYHMPELYELDLHTNVEGLKYALQQIVSRHEVLRSTIEQGDNKAGAVQVVHTSPLVIEEIMVSDTVDYKSLMHEEINRPFDLTKEYPIRVKLYCIQQGEAASKGNKIILLINTHHIASDGWSTEVFQKELFAYYEAYINKDTAFRLPELGIQYKDYACWQRAYLTGEVLNRQLSYWKDKLTGYQTLEFPTDYVRPNKVDYNGGLQKFVLNREISQKLRSLAQTHGISLNSVMLSSLKVLLGKYTGQQDIVVGSAIANRRQNQTQDLIGFFVNMQAHRTLLTSDQSFTDLIQQVHQDQVEAQTHQDLPFEKLVNELKLERDTSRHPVFQVTFEVTNLGEHDLQQNYLKPYELEDLNEVEKFDLSFYINDSQKELSGHITYATSLFHPDTIKRFTEHYIHLLNQLTQAPDKAYSQLSLLSAEEYKQIIYDWNATDKEFSENKTIHQLFEEQVKATPDRIALVYGQQQLTYKELNEKSNQLARHIRKQYEAKTKQTLAPDTLIALCLDRSVEMLIGILAVLKAGGAYVPIDPTFPRERIDYILEDTGAVIVLSQQQLNENPAIHLPQDKVINIGLTATFYKEEDTSNLRQHAWATDLCYVIYTSGTTGHPKGVMIEQRGVINLIQDLLQQYKIDSSERFLLFSNYVFDAAAEQIYLSLFSGGTLYMIDHASVIDNDHFVKFVVNNGITHLDSTPSYMSTVDASKLSGVKRLVLGAEFLSQTLFSKFKASIPVVINAYGPTEATITSIVSVNSAALSKASIQNTKVYILDSNRKPVPIGVTGELYIGGAGLARGYLNRPDLTAERFIANPFTTGDQAKAYTRLYKTGDVVKWLADGTLEYIGRNDDQVKLQGYRIELGEIENALIQVKGIQQSCVLAKERKTETGSTNYLVAYYVRDKKEEDLSQAGIQNKLRQLLPEYMVPGVLVEIEKFPLTINGKLDKRALPDAGYNPSAEERIAPVTEIEIKLCEIYASVLGLPPDQISTHQNFFRMGGNSILSIQLKRKLNQLDEFKLLSVADLFKHNSIKKLIESIQQANSTVYKLQNSRNKNGAHEIAIIAVSGAFSGAATVTEFWDLISGQQEGLEFYNKEECIRLGVEEALLEDPAYVPVAGQVKGIELFDPLFWGLSPNEARQLDPQIRKFIEHCWYALESAGYIAERKNQHIGVFAGSGSGDYFSEHILQAEHSGQINLWEASTANSKDALATKTAFLLGLSGPANSINTACSTGLVAVVEACKNLQLGTCTMALAGGVSLTLPDQVGYVYEEGMIMSRDGHCKTFDKEASGTIAGSGIGVVVLKRLADAIKEKDTVLGVIKGYASNNDGDRKSGYTAPSVIGQSECIINAQMMAGITSDQIDYVECHGTATPLGDPIEVQALKEAFTYTKSTNTGTTYKTILGAVKANIGHTDSAAGTAGLIKVCAMLQNNIIPGQLNYTTPNADLNLGQSNFEIITENRPWLAAANRQRLAGVSSFGIGGTNAHVIIGDFIEQADKQEETRKAEDDLMYIVPVSAKSRASLELYKKVLANYLSESVKDTSASTIRDIAYTLQERREQFNYRSAYCAKNVKDLTVQLKQDNSYAETATENKNKVVFMFPGQGVQYTQMAKELYLNEPFFKAGIDQCISIANQYTDVDLFQVLYPAQEVALFDIHETQWTQISLFIVEYTLATYLAQLGVKADAYIGHSIGEYVAATLSGVFSLEDAIKTVITRAKLMQSMQTGSMLAIHADEKTVKAIIQEHACEIAVVNSMEDLVVSGTGQAIEALKQTLDQQAIPALKLTTSHAYHSVMMEQAATEFEKVMKEIKLHPPAKYFVSNLNGEIAREEVCNAAYWAQQLRKPVEFAKGVTTLSKLYNHQVTFVEVGTGKGLCSFVNKYKNKNGHQSIQTMQVLPSEKEAKLNGQVLRYKEELIAKLWMNGILQQANEPKLFIHAKFIKDLPGYQFDFQKCWIEKNKNNSSTDQLRLLQRDNWLSAPVWSAVAYLSTNRKTGNVPFKKSLVFLRADQLNVFDFTELSLSFQFVVLDTGETNGFNINKNNLIRMHPENEQHFEKLAEYLKVNNTFDSIIHIASLNKALHIDVALSYSFYSLFLIRRHLLNNPALEKLLVLSNGLAQLTNEDEIIPANGTLMGAIRNINHELTIDARLIDIGYEQKHILTGIVQLMNNTAYSKSENLLAIRFGKIWKESFEQVNPIAEESIIEEGDVILITGGLGGIALAIAKHIADKHKVKFILVSRKDIYENKNQSAYVKQKIELIENIRNNGSSVEIQCADIADMQQLTVLMTRLKEKYDCITGVIHTAGVSPVDTDKYSIATIRDAFKGKVYGIDHLLKLTDKKQLKFFASTSSLASIIGDVNRMEYCASNSYLDYLAVDLHGFGNTRVISVNWPGWSDTGMAKEDEESENSEPLKGLENLMQLNAVDQAEGGELFYQLINQTAYRQVVVSKLDIGTLVKKLFKRDLNPVLNKEVSILEEDFTAQEFQVARIFGDVLGLEQISLYDDFFKIGGNSILAIQLSHRLSAVLDSDVKAADVFRLKSCRALVENTKLLEVDAENIEMEF